MSVLITGIATLIAILIAMVIATGASKMTVSAQHVGTQLTACVDLPPSSMSSSTICEFDVHGIETASTACNNVIICNNSKIILLGTEVRPLTFIFCCKQCFKGGYELIGCSLQTI